MIDVPPTMINNSVRMDPCFRFWQKACQKIRGTLC